MAVSAEDLAAVIHGGDVAALERMLAEDPTVATAPLGGRFRDRTPLHIVTDWPGYFPNGPEVVRVLVAAGADPNARGPRKGDESPLHWAASSDDADVAAALIDGGADIELPDGSIGTPLDNAIGYGCWNVARLLVARGAAVDKLWHAAALGMTGRLRELLEQSEWDSELVSQGLYHACAGGQRRAAELLLDHGADLNWSPDYAWGTPLDAAQGRGTQAENVIEWLRGRGARSAASDGGQDDRQQDDREQNEQD
jgi:hypothetical protein